MERSSAQISAIFHSPFHTKGTGTSKGLTGLFARNMNINWVRKKQNDLFFFFFPLFLQPACDIPSSGAGASDGPPKDACYFNMGSNIRLSKSTPQSRKYYIIYTLTPSSCFSFESSRENAFFFTFPQHMGQSWGISTRRGRTSVRPATPMRRHLRLQVWG